MDMSTFITCCKQMMQKNGLPCTDEQAETFYRLTVRILEVNRSMNLTAITEESDMILRHYIDSLTLSEHLPEGASLLDVGCGAGFPTLPLAIARPDLRILGVDGTAKRIAYVRETAELLGLRNVEVISARAEELAHEKDYRECFDVVTARAVASLPVLCELCLPFVRLGGRMIAMKAKNAQEELVSSKNAISCCGGSSPSTIDLELRGDSAKTEQRTLIFIPKTKETPKNYPRHFSKISKKPL